MEGLLLLGPLLLGLFFLMKHFARSDMEVIASQNKHIEDMKVWEQSTKGLPYKHYHADTGIAVDPQNRLIYLKSFQGEVSLQKVYSFSDIRGWKYNISSGGHVTPGTVYGGGASALGANIGEAFKASHMNSKINAQNEQETGLFLQVRDIDMPEWQVIFPTTTSREIDLKRWMEILQQNINESG